MWVYHLVYLSCLKTSTGEYTIQIQTSVQLHNSCCYQALKLTWYVPLKLVPTHQTTLLHAIIRLFTKWKPQISLKYNQQDATFSWSIYFYKLLYMFQAVPPPIIRRTKLYVQCQVLSNQYCCLLLSWMRWNCWLNFRDTLAMHGHMNGKFENFKVYFSSINSSMQHPEISLT